VQPPEVSALDALLFFLTPSVLWLTLTILIGSGLRQPSRAASTLGVYIAATVVRRIVWESRFTAVLCVGLVLAKVGLGCVLRTELEWLEKRRQAAKRAGAVRMTSVLA